MKKKWKEWFNENKALAIVIGIIVLILAAVFGTKILLFFNFILGNDTVVKLNINKEALSLVHGGSENVEFEASVTTNPFCSTVCNSKFEDLSSGKVVEQDEFKIRPGLPIKKEFEIKANRFGSGQELYRFNMECNSERTFLCETAGEKTTRSVLLTVQYNFSDDEKALKEELKSKLNSFADRLSEMKGKREEFEKAAVDLNRSVDDFRIDFFPFKKKFSSFAKQMQKMQDIWEQQDIFTLQNEINGASIEFSEAENEFEKLNESVSSAVESYNSLINGLVNSHDMLVRLRNEFLLNETKAIKINETIVEFNDAVGEFKKRDTIENKKSLATDIFARVKSIFDKTGQEQKREAMKRELILDVEYDAKCEIVEDCVLHPSIKERANQTIFNLNESCAKIDELQLEYDKLAADMADDYAQQNYPNTDEFRGNISLKVKNIKQNITNKYLGQVDVDSANFELIDEFMVRKEFFDTQDYPEYNLTPALAIELAKQRPEKCIAANVTMEEVNEIGISEVAIKEFEFAEIDFSFEDVNAMCYLFGERKECCVSEECRDKNLPVVFLHGHAVSRDVSYEYSLEGYNKLQKKLEEEGYVSAGAISLYTKKEVPQGTWGMFDAPFTIRGSYYFDLFKEPENYVVVQTKSQIIDTYAVRLKEVIDTIKYKTGKEKVKMVAFSMGGLVARRYIQIFGTEDIDRLIMIGTPNHGIVGDIATLCPVTGESKECEDMDAKSLFINKLNRGELPGIPIYNIVGTGCNMAGKQGDGAVLEESAVLEGAQNFVIEGKCRSLVRPLHLDLLDIELYPEVYEIVKGALEE